MHKRCSDGFLWFSFQSYTKGVRSDDTSFPNLNTTSVVHISADNHTTQISTLSTLPIIKTSSQSAVPWASAHISSELKVYSKIPQDRQLFLKGKQTTKSSNSSFIAKLSHTLKAIPQATSKSLHLLPTFKHLWQGTALFFCNAGRQHIVLYR